MRNDFQFPIQPAILRICLGILLVGMAVPGFAFPKLHLIVACDTRDKGIGDSVQKDKEQIVERFNAWFGSQAQIHVLNSNSFTHQDILDAIDETQVNPDDTLMFYYSGHGAYNYSKGTQLLTLMNREKVPRSELLAAMMKKNARLVICVTDCCNGVVLDYEPEEETKSEVVSRSKPGLQKLFFEERGVVDITSSKIGELSLSTEGGGLFTIAMWNFFEKSVDNKYVEWADITDFVQPQMTSYFKDILERKNKDGIDLSELEVPEVPGIPNIQRNQRAHIYCYPNMPLRLGVTVTNKTSTGVFVKKVVSGGPGSQAGIEAGDVLLAINGTEITSPTHYGILVDYSPKQMRVTVRKSSGKTTDLVVNLAYE